MQYPHAVDLAYHLRDSPRRLLRDCLRSRVHARRRRPRTVGARDGRRASGAGPERIALGRAYDGHSGRQQLVVVGRQNVVFLVLQLVVERVDELLQLVELQLLELRRHMQRIRRPDDECGVSRVQREVVPEQRLLRRVLLRSLHDEVRPEARGLLTIVVAA
jgi:hypothetical protein